MLLLLLTYAFVWAAVTMSYYIREMNGNLDSWYLTFPLQRFKKAARSDRVSKKTRSTASFFAQVLHLQLNSKLTDDV
jgi:hypothetical protein